MMINQKLQKILKMSNKVNNACCQIEAVVSVDERGQVVIPKDVRKRFGINPGDKYALVSCSDDKGEICCFTLMKTQDMQGVVQQALGPVFKEIVSN